VDTLIAWLANYLLWVMAVVAVVFWLRNENRAGKVELAVSAVVGLVLTLALITLLAHLHSDPRPFVQNPHLHPLISHSADNGFPSDHSAVAGLIATLVALRNRVWGLGLAVLAIVVAVARVAAHVHHVQDVVAGLAIGAAGAVIATLLVRFVVDRRRPALLR
jgi:membrane-associated phospholipid phosphatase